MSCIRKRGNVDHLTCCSLAPLCGHYYDVRSMYFGVFLFSAHVQEEPNGMCRMDLK